MGGKERGEREKEDSIGRRELEKLDFRGACRKPILGRRESLTIGNVPGALAVGDNFAADQKNVHADRMQEVLSPCMVSFVFICVPSLSLQRK